MDWRTQEIGFLKDEIKELQKVLIAIVLQNDRELKLHEFYLKIIDSEMKLEVKEDKHNRCFVLKIAE